MLYFNNQTQQIMNSNELIIQDFSESRFLSRLNNHERQAELKKFCQFKFQSELMFC